jgi:hypothetical protein
MVAGGFFCEENSSIHFITADFLGVILDGSGNHATDITQWLAQAHGI